jgi:hypothetical protein
MKPTQSSRCLAGLPIALATTRLRAGLLAAGLLATALAACGGSSGGTRAGSGGTTGSGGVSGTAGTGAGTGGAASGTGGAASGSGGAAALACQSPAAAPATLTNFSDWDPTSGKWGSANSVIGGIFQYNSTGSTLQVAVAPKTTGDNALHFSGTVVPAMTGGGYAGGGLSFDVCATAAAYTGIGFTVSGLTGGCALELQLQTFSTKPANNGGGCQTGCVSAGKTNLAVPGPVTVNFSDLSAAGPGPFSAAELVGIQWQLTIPPGVAGAPQAPCTVDMYVDDVTFVK